jgi:hypothetical protein
MTNELEKQFFDTFNIEPIGCNDNKNCTGALDCTQCSNAKYPQITDRILLELICIRCKELISIIKVKGDNREELKNYILKLCIEDYTFYSKTSEKTYNELANNFKHQVRTLFEEV